MNISDIKRQRANAKKRRERMAAARLLGTHTKEEWLELKSFFNVCVRCEGESGLINIEKDHIIPVYQGGSDSIKNIQPFCALCNAKKGPDNTDYRKVYCEKHMIDFPAKWDNKNGTL